MAKAGLNPAVARATARREAIVAIRFLGERARSGFQVADLCLPGGPATTRTAASTIHDRAVQFGNVVRQDRGGGWRFTAEMLAAAALSQEQTKIAPQKTVAPLNQCQESKKTQPSVVGQQVEELRLLFHYMDLEVGSTLEISAITPHFGSKVPGLPAFPYFSISQARARLNTVAMARHSPIERTGEDCWTLRTVLDQWMQERLAHQAKAQRSMVVAAPSVQSKSKAVDKPRPVDGPPIILCSEGVVMQVFIEYYGVDVLIRLGGGIFDETLDDDDRWMRGVLIYLYFEYTTMTVPEIGARVGLKSAASVYRWRNEIDADRRNYSAVRAQLDEIKQLIVSKLETPPLL